MLQFYSPTKENIKATNQNSERGITKRQHRRAKIAAYLCGLSEDTTSELSELIYCISQLFISQLEIRLPETTLTFTPSIVAYVGGNIKKAR